MMDRFSQDRHDEIRRIVPLMSIEYVYLFPREARFLRRMFVRLWDKKKLMTEKQDMRVCVIEEYVKVRKRYAE